MINFTLPSTPVFDFGTTKGNGYDYTGVALNPSVKVGYRALYAGDFDANKKIKTENPNDDLNTLFFEIFHTREIQLQMQTMNLQSGIYKVILI